jgi:hypothetical protein
MVNAAWRKTKKADIQIEMVFTGRPEDTVRNAAPPVNLPAG